MRFKALMADVDGVVIVHPDGQGWAAHIERDLGLSRKALQAAFFRPYWRDIILGHCALRSRLEPVLAEIAPQVGVDAFIRYWFEHDAHLDRDLLAQFAEIRAQGLALHLATVQEHERAHYIWQTLGLNRHFDAMHYAAALGCAKPDEAFYAAVERRSGFGPADIFFIDDSEANVAAARRRGWSAAVWDGTRRLDDLLDEAGR